MPIQPEQRMRIDILQEKRMADCLDKMCPMCGKIYSNTATFEVFQEHVESHFIDDTDLDMSVEKNFEFVSNTVGNFWRNIKTYFYSDVWSELHVFELLKR